MHGNKIFALLGGLLVIGIIIVVHLVDEERQSVADRAAKAQPLVPKAAPGLPAPEGFDVQVHVDLAPGFTGDLQVQVKVPREAVRAFRYRYRSNRGPGGTWTEFTTEVRRGDDLYHLELGDRNGQLSDH